MSEEDTSYLEAEEIFSSLPDCMKITLIQDYVKADKWAYSVIYKHLTEMEKGYRRQKDETFYNIHPEE